MCGRFASLLTPQFLALITDTFGVPAPVGAEPRYNIAPTQSAWVIRNAGDHNRLDLMRWGLIPPGTKGPRIGASMINARCETVHEKQAFRAPLKYRRCIVPASGYYEWKHEGAHKQPHYIHMSDGSAMFLAGIWEQWKQPGAAEPLETFLLLTTAANRLVEPLHDQMPVILQPDYYQLWLSHSMHDIEQLPHMYQPIPAEALAVHRVSDLVNSTHSEGAACIEKV